MILHKKKKDKIIEKILNCSQFISPELLKLATAYRYVNHYVQKDSLIQELSDNFNQEEIKLSRLIVMTIIKETNILFEECSLTADGKEISYGLFNHDIFERDCL